MAQRRALLEGVGKNLKVDPELAEAFVYGKNAKAKSAEVAKEAEPARPAAVEPAEVKGQGQAASPISRVGLTTRIRSDYAAALKRASLERELKRVTPYTQQDILEQALEPWLRSNGYLN
jgi:hypothetical protein